MFKGVVNKVVPFVLTFAAGLLIASLFVPITMPNFNGLRRSSGKYREVKHLRHQVRELERSNMELRRQLKEYQMGEQSSDGLSLDVPPPPPPPPAVRSMGHVEPHVDR